MKALTTLGAAIGAALAHDISFSGGPIYDPAPPLFPLEAKMLGNVALRRRREFAWGRHHAHEALRRLGFTPVPILSRSDRAPLWPLGVVGSISHSSSDCGAVAGRSRNVLALGLDIEDEEPLGADLLPIICTPAELQRREWSSNRLGPKLIFVIKEAVYKSYSPETGEFLDFQDAGQVTRVGCSRRRSSIQKNLRVSAVALSMEFISRFSEASLHWRCDFEAGSVALRSLQSLPGAFAWK
ncbi:4'-phosphopantetheinyl transferase superfamily protein [Bradyrhizobium sp. Ec3.3]|uniref:4'-phosphopantetheinyl transferase family protein n=1 Tax=Bradyrhizobium sp. Ec3.3 TaxID=189753 RepID=UPI000A06B2E6